MLRSFFKSQMEKRSGRQRTRSRGALPSSPPGAGGRLLDLYAPMPPR
jgi:hypothetical protein